MSGFTNLIRKGLFFQLFGGTAGQLPTYSVLFVNLLTTLPTSDGDGSAGSPSDQVEWGVVRQPINKFLSSAPQWSAFLTTGFSAEVSNADDIAWSAGEVSSLPASILVLGVGLWDAVSGGNLVAWDKLDTQITAVPTNSYRFPAGNLKVRMQGIVK